MTEEAAKWTAYCYRLVSEGKRNTAEFAAVYARAIAALGVSEPPPESVPIPVPAIVVRPVEKKRSTRPDEDATPEIWQDYLDDLALSGKEDSPEYSIARSGLERAKRPLLSQKGSLSHGWGQLLPTGSGKTMARHAWLKDEREEGSIYESIRRRKAQ